MKVEDAIESLEAIQKANIKNYQDALDTASISYRKVKETKKQIELLELESFKLFKSDGITINQWNKIKDSIDCIGVVNDM